MAQVLKTTNVKGTDWANKSAQGVTSEGSVAVMKGTTDYNATVEYFIKGLPKTGAGIITLNWEQFPKETGAVIDYSSCTLKDLQNPSVLFNMSFNSQNLPDLSRFVNDQGIMQLSICLTYCREVGKLASIEVEEC